MKKVLLIFITVSILAFTSCSGTSADGVGSGQNKDDNFVLKIFTDKGTYSPHEPIKCYATVEYIGEGNGVTVYNIDPLVGFSVMGENFYGGYDSYNILGTTEFIKGVPVRYNFEKRGEWLSSRYSYNGKDLFLSDGKYEISANMIYFRDNDISPGKGHTLSASVAVNANLLSTEIIIVFIIIGLGFVTIPSLLMINKMRKQIHSWRHLNDYDPSREETFEEKLKKAKLNPQKAIIYGQNRIAADSIKKKLFIQSSKAPDGVLLGFEDIVSYELIKDGKVIAAPGVGWAGGTAAAGEDGIICSDLRLVIKTKKTSDPEVTLPFIAFSIDSEFAYSEALGTAREAVEELSGMIR